MTAAALDDGGQATRPVDSIAVVDRHRTDLGDISALATSIATEGLLHPVVITTSGRLIAGERRLTAVRSLGWTEVPVTVVGDVTDAADLLRMERDENQCRKEMTPSEKIALGRALEELERPKARERQARAGREHGRGIAPVPANGSNRQERYDTREIVAPAVDMTTATYSRAKALVTAAESGDAVAAEMVEQMDRTGQVTPAYEKWKGHPVNRGDAAPTTRDTFGLTSQAQPPRKAVKNYRGAPATRAVPKTLVTLAGIAHGMAGLTAADIESVPPEVRAEWARDLSEVLSALRSVRDLIRETP